VRSLISNSTYAKKDRHGPPSANQVVSIDKPWHSHAVCILPILPFLLKQKLSPKDIAENHIMRLNVSWSIHVLWALKR